MFDSLEGFCLESGHSRSVLNKGKSHGMGVLEFVDTMSACDVVKGVMHILGFAAYMEF